VQIEKEDIPIKYAKIDNRLKIAYLTNEHAHDKRSLSSSLYYMERALEQHCGEVTYLERVLSWEKRYVARLMQEATKHIFKRRIVERRLLFVAKKQAKVAAQRIAGQQFDVIVAPDGAPDIAFLQTDIPILLPMDLTFRLQRTANPEFSRLLGICASQGEMMERAAFQKASKLLFSSPWAARSAVEDYGIEPQKVHAIFWGTNLDHTPPQEQVLAKKLSGECRLLFMSLGWQRKGGDIAYDTLLKLHEMGIQAELTVCGTTPPPGIAHEHMTVIPYLDKNDEQQAAEIEKLYAMSDFLILPTRADCVPNVLGEAYAFGVPAIIADTGGIADVVRNGENGYVLPYEARGEAYAQVIAELYRDEQRYRLLVQSSRATFETHLNWDAWGMTVKNILNEMLEVKGAEG
jgi:glycosyltransferase involved in cell wall biosynthesis